MRFEGKTTLNYQLEDRRTVSTSSADWKLCTTVPLSAVSDSSIAVEISRLPLPPRCQYSAPHGWPAKLLRACATYWLDRSAGSAFCLLPLAAGEGKKQTPRSGQANKLHK